MLTVIGGRVRGKWITLLTTADLVLLAALNALRTDAHAPDYVCYDEARIGFPVSDDLSPPAIREKASLIVSVVFFAPM
jgi:hypothetical protein